MDCSSTNTYTSVGVALGVAVLLCSILCSCPYSGMDQPPLFGDYEAQRHWMELSVNLPLGSLYENSSDNDLSYWGLDYPPLTVYHSYLLGTLKRIIDPDWVELHSSRGVQSPTHKLFMRSSVIAAFIVLYIPASLLITSSFKRPSVGLGIALLNPGLLLIDNAHFQYNCVSLALFMLAVGCIDRKKHILGSLLFSLALNYKQMELYHSLPIFCHLLAHCLDNGIGTFPVRVSKLGLTVVLVFAVLWIPYLGSLASLKQVLLRLFPLGRGLFEDKVANLWCSLNVVFKIKTHFSESSLATLSALVTLIGSAPSCVVLFRSGKRTKSHFHLSLVSTALAFYLFSYQVHEKSILLVATPLLFLLEEHKHINAHTIVHMLSVCSLSMGHLFIKDGFLLTSVALTLMFSITFHSLISMNSPMGNSLKVSVYVSWGGFLLLSALMAFASTPPTLPHLYVVALCLYSLLHFISLYIHITLTACLL